MDVTFTMIRTGTRARQYDTGVVVFDLDSDGVILGVHAPGGADWVSEMIKLAMGGKLRLAES